MVKVVVAVVKARDMEASMEEQLAAPPPLQPQPDNKDLSPIAKGKRTKRFRPHSPIPFTITTPHGQDPAFSAASSEESTTTSEVDMARCLILLSQGYRPHPATTNRRYAVADNNAAAAAAPGATRCGTGGAYTCKTCGRSFPSFQALGGHRTSHKKPKNDKKLFTFLDEDDFPSQQRNMFSPNSLSLQLSNISSTTFSATPKSSPSPRIHECSYCGAEFTSGQALGGHMRKHRGSGFITRSSNISSPDAYVEEHELRESKKAKIGLSLDLNLPAPEDATQVKNTKVNIEETAGLTLSTTNSPLPPHDQDCH